MHKQNSPTSLLRSVVFYLLVALFSTASLAEAEPPQKIHDVELFAQAVEYSLQQQWALAEPIYRVLIERHPEWPEPANNLAVLLLKTNRIDETKSVLERAVISSPSYRVAQKNRSDLYNYLATRAYDKALGAEQTVTAPELQLIDTIYQPVKVIEIEVEKIVIQKKIVEVPSATDELPEAQKDIVRDSQEQISEQLKQQLMSWSQAWSQGDFETYIQNYSKDFLPSDARKSYTEWKNVRRARLKFIRGVSIEIEQLRVFLEPQEDYALVEFIQNYHSKSYSDRILKQVYVGFEQGNWQILSERTIKIY